MNILIDPFSGISGDMIIGALLHLGGDFKKLKKDLSKTGVLKNFNISWAEDRTNSIKAGNLIISPKKKKISPLSFNEQKKIISSSDIGNEIKNKSLNMLEKLAESEAISHGIRKDKVVFHELGGWDTIIDLVGISNLLTNMKIEKIYTFPINVGRGKFKTSHGYFISPAPATEKLLKGFPIYREGEIENTTPTGAVFLNCFSKPVPFSFLFIPQNVAYGLGKKKIKDSLNALRIYEIEEDEIENKKVENLYQIETDIDDITAEEAGLIIPSLLEKGALEANIAQTLMKKGRPGIRITALADYTKIKQINNYLLEETPTAGVRFWSVKREKIKRKVIKIKTIYGKIRIKVYTRPSGRKSVKPEIDDLLKIKQKTGKPLDEIKREIIKELKKYSETFP